MYNVLGINNVVLHIRDSNFAPPRLTRPLFTSPCMGFPRFAKVVGWGWGKILAPPHRMGLEFLNPPRPALPFPVLAPTLPRIVKGYNCKFFIS